MSLEAIMKAVEQVETKIAESSTKAAEEIKVLGKVSADTKTALDNFGIEQRTLADRLLKIEQKSSAKNDDAPKADTFGSLLIATPEFKNYLPSLGKSTSKMGVELKNTITNAIGNTFSERRPDVVGGAFREFTIEDLLVAIPTSSNSIDYVRENVFTNSAAETTEGAALAQSAITFSSASMPVQNIGHFLKITRQLAQDNAALAVYVDRRMIYGVNMRCENQLIAGNGTSPNLSGLTNTGNFTAHGYTAASLTALGLSPTNRLDLIAKMIGDCALADFAADVILLNTADWWTMRLAKDSQGRYLLGEPSSAHPPTLWGRPVVASNAMVAGKVWVGSLKQAATLHNREGVLLDMSDSDENNFQLGLITIRAMRRLALTVERPAAARYGDLVPA